MSSPTELQCTRFARATLREILYADTICAHASDARQFLECIKDRHFVLLQIFCFDVAAAEQGAVAVRRPTALPD